MAERDLKIRFTAEDQNLSSVAQNAAQGIDQISVNAEAAQASLAGLTGQLEGLGQGVQPIDVPIIVDPDQVTDQLGDLPSEVPPVEIPVFADATGFIDKLNLELAQVQAVQLDIAGDAEAANLAKEQAALLAEALRYKQQLASIDNAGFSPEDAAAARATADAINSIRVDSIKAGFADLDSTVDEAKLSLDDLVGSAGSVIAQVAAIGASFAAFQESLALFTDADTDIRIIDSLLAKTGNSAGVTTAQITQLADELSDATLTTESAVLGAANKLLSFQSISGETFTRAITLTQDLSQVMGGDLESNILQVAKALEDPARGLTALARSGTTFTEEQQNLIKSLVETGKQAEAQSVILDVLEQQYGGAALAAAGGLAGSLDTLGEELNDLKRAFGEELAKPFNEIVKLGIQAINVFNEAPPVFQKSVIGATALVAAYGSLQAAISLATNKIIVQTLVTQKQALTSALLATKTAAVTTAQAAMAIATGQATTAQIAQGKAVLASTASLGAMAAAAIAVTAAIDTFLSVTQETRSTDQLFSGAEKAIERFRVSIGEASQSSEQFSEDLNAVQRNLDKVRSFLNDELQTSLLSKALRAVGAEVPKISTAAESLARNQEIAFQNAIDRGDEARQELGAFVDELVSGEVKTAESILEAKSAIDAQIEAIKNQTTVGEQQAADQRNQITLLEALKTRLDDAAGSTGNLTDATLEQVSALEQANESIANRERLAEQQANQDEQRIQEEIRRRVQAGESIEDVESSVADRRLAIDERLAQDRVKIAQQNLRDLEAARAQETDPADLAKIQDQIVQAETALGDAQVEAATATTDRVVGEYQRAADERERIIQESIERLDQLNAKAEADTNLYIENEIAAIREQQRDKVITAEEAQERIARVEMQASQQRLAAIDQEIAEVNRLQSEGVLSQEDALTRLTDLSVEKAGIRRAAIEQEIAIQEQSAAAAEAAAERQRQAVDEQLNAQSRLIDLANQAQAANLNVQVGGLQIKQGLLTSELDLLNAQYDTQIDQLETEKLRAELRGDEEEAREIALMQEDLRAGQAYDQLDIKAQQIELQIQQNELEAQSNIANAQKEASLARVAVLQAQNNGASAEELALLKEIADISDQQYQNALDSADAIDQQNENLREGLELERQRLSESEERRALTTDRDGDGQPDGASGSSASPSAGGTSGGGRPGGGDSISFSGGQATAFFALKDDVDRLIQQANGDSERLGQSLANFENVAEGIVRQSIGRTATESEIKSVVAAALNTGIAGQTLGAVREQQALTGDDGGSVVREIQGLRNDVASLQPNVQNISVSGSQDPGRDAANASYELARNDRRRTR